MEDEVGDEAEAEVEDEAEGEVEDEVENERLRMRISTVLCSMPSVRSSKPLAAIVWT